MTIIAGLSSVPAGSHPVSKAGRAACAPSGTIKVWGSPKARVFRSRRTKALYGCWMPTGRRTELDLPPDSVAFPPPAIALAGPNVALAVEGTSDPNERDDTVIVVTDLRDGEGASAFVPRRTPWATERPDAFDSKVGSVKVKPNGAVAWIACRTAGSTPEEWGDPRPSCLRRGAFNEVRKFDAGSGTAKTLDRGRGIDPRSLRRKGDRISWRHGKRQRTARLR